MRQRPAAGRGQPDVTPGAAAFDGQRRLKFVGDEPFLGQTREGGVDRADGQLAARPRLDFPEDRHPVRVILEPGDRRHHVDLEFRKERLRRHGHILLKGEHIDEAGASQVGRPEDRPAGYTCTHRPGGAGTVRPTRLDRRPLIPSVVEMSDRFALACGLLNGSAKETCMRQHRQIHIWITESDYLMLHEQSAEERASMSAILRRLIRTERARLREGRPGPPMLPEDLHLETLQ